MVALTIKKNSSKKTISGKLAVEISVSLFDFFDLNFIVFHLSGSAMDIFMGIPDFPFS